MLATESATTVFKDPDCSMIVSDKTVKRGRDLRHNHLCVIGHPTPARTENRPQFHAGQTATNPARDPLTALHCAPTTRNRQFKEGDAMPETTVLLAYIAVLTGFVLFPGPSMLLTLARATASGTRVGIATSLGIAAGDVVHTILAVVGLSAAVMASAEAFFVIKMLGALYLVWLGIRSFLEHVPVDDGPQPASTTSVRAFREACLAEILNPKSAMFFLAFLPQFVVVEQGGIAMQLLVFGLLFILFGTLATLAVALAAGAIGGFLRRNPAVRKWQGKIAGTILCGLGARLALQER